MRSASAPRAVARPDDSIVTRHGSEPFVASHGDRYRCQHVHGENDLPKEGKTDDVMIRRELLSLVDAPSPGARPRSPAVTSSAYPAIQGVGRSRYTSRRLFGVELGPEMGVSGSKQGSHGSRGLWRPGGGATVLSRVDLVKKGVQLGTVGYLGMTG